MLKGEYFQTLLSLTPYIISTFFRYDLHLLVEELNVKNFGRPPKVLPKNTEKFRTLTLGRFKIQDSLEHMPASLDALVKDLNQSSNHAFPILQQMDRYRKLSTRDKSRGLKLLTRKGVFCYEHFQSLDQMKQAKNLPSLKDFYSELNEEVISESDYNFAKKVFRFFKCQNMADYMMLYCSLDVSLLCETFLQYRNMVMKHFELDPAYYLGKNFVCF